MQFARLPFFVLPLTALVSMALVALFLAMVDQVHLRGAYQVWQENETFAAATIALLAAMYGARPVYLQVRAQAVQAALDLLHRVEGDAEASIEARKALFEVRRVSVALAGEIIEYTVAHEPSPQDLKRATEAFMALSPQYLRALAERPTINAADQIKIATLSFVLSIAQRGVADLLAHEKDGAIAHAAAVNECEFITTKLAGLFSLSSEIAEDLERQEDVMRRRAQHLRDAADAL